MRFLPAFTCLAAVLGTAATAFPQATSIDALIGRRISSVAVRAEDQPVTGTDVLALIETRVDHALTMADVRESVLHLASVGRFDAVSVEGEPDGEDVAVTYRLVETRRVTRLTFGGTLGVPARRLRQVLGSRALGVPTADRREGVERALRSFYETLGYFGATVAVTIQDRPDPLHSTMLVTVDAGPRARIDGIRVTGSGLTTPNVLARLRVQSGQPWDASALEERIQSVVDELRANGYYEASISWSLNRHDDAVTVNLSIDANTGPLVRLAFESDDIPARRLREFVPIEREGAVDEDLLEDSKRRIESWLHGQGYADAVVDYSRVEEDGELRITVTVKRGPAFYVERIDLSGVQQAREAEVRELVTLTPEEPFSDEALVASAMAVRQFYQARGFGSVQVETQVGDATPGPSPDSRLVRPRIIVTEGERTAVRRILLNGAAPSAEEGIRALLGLKAGSPFYVPQLIADRNAVQAFYVNRGYRNARVDVVPRAADEPNLIDVEYDIDEGPQFILGHLLIAGNVRTSAETITREAGLTPGGPLGGDELVGAQRRLSALGLFRRVSVDEVSLPGRLITDVALTVEEAPPTTIGYGIGLEGGRRLVRDSSQAGAAVERIEVAPRGFFEIGRRNLWGKNRSVNLFTRFSLRDRGGSQDSTAPDDSAFYEFRIVGTYREPKILGTTIDGQVSGFVEQGVRSSFNFARQGVNAEAARRVSPTVTVVGRYSFGQTKLFDQRLVAEEKPIIDRLYPQVRLSTVSVVLIQDTRNDPLDPSSGHVANAESDISLHAIGSEVGFVKEFVQGFVYRQLPGTRVVFAGGARLGLATGFGVTNVSDPDVAVRDLPASERFYAGGSTTVRGYALDRLGDDATIDSDGFPRGGNALLILNAELRFPVWRSLGGVAFVDAGNVFARAADFDVGRLKASVRTGVRYKSPIGPIRVDLGFKLDPRELSTSATERRWEVHISLGQAF